jgi:beta-glucosidase
LNEEPLYPFGYGLSYSSFRYSEPAATQGGAAIPPDASAAGENSFPGDAPIKVSVRVTNASGIPGEEVAELYLSHPGVDGAPLRALAGFQRVCLEANASQTVRFTLSPRELSVVDANGIRVVPEGPVSLWIGSSQPITIQGRPAPAGVALSLKLTSSANVAN